MVRQTGELTEALLGTSVAVPTLEGKNLNLKIPPGTQHKTKMRLSGHGLPHMQATGKGDLYVHVHLIIPGKLSRAQKMIVFCSGLPVAISCSKKLRHIAATRSGMRSRSSSVEAS